MQSEPMINVIKGGGGSQNIKEGRRATTLTEDTFGRVEYYIDNVRIESVLQPGGMGSRMPAVHTFQFEVTEPYSLGNFMESLQVAAVTAGYKQYISAPFLLMCEFIGHTDENTTKRVAKRYFPIQLSTTSITADAGGTKYDIQAEKSQKQNSLLMNILLCFLRKKILQVRLLQHHQMRPQEKQHMIRRKNMNQDMVHPRVYRS